KTLVAVTKTPVPRLLFAARGLVCVYFLVVVVARLELALGDGGDAVLEEPAGECRTNPLTNRDLALIVGADHEGLVVVEVDESPAVVLVELLVHLDVLTAGESHDATRFDAVQHDLAVLALECEARALGDDVRGDGAEDEQRLEGVRHPLDRELEVRGHEVGAGRGPHDGVEGDAGGTDRGARGGVAGP